MRKLRKKALALVVAAMMVAAMAPTAFAGFSDVPADSKYAAAIGRLAALDIVKGFPDGTFQPNGTFTRAQAAAIAVRLSGITTSVGPAETQFKDVSSSHWAGGVINLAVGLGIIKGYPDGTFKPDNPVTHAEWLAMVLRVLGYGPQVNKMPWPGGVLAKAALLGLNNGVTITPNLPASRAEVAQIADNSLTAKIVECDFDAEGNAMNCRPGTKTIINDLLKVAKAEGTVDGVPDTDTSLNADQLKIDGAAKTLLSAGVVADVNALLGMKVEYGTKDVSTGEGTATRVVYVKVITPADKVKSGTVAEDATGTSIKVKSGDTTTEYEWASTPAVFLNYRGGASKTDATKDSAVTVILDDNNKVRAAIVKKAHATSPGKVKEVKVKGVGGATANEITFYAKGDTTTTTYNSDLASNLVVFRNGKRAKLGDLQADDIINIYKNGTEITSVEATSNTVSGTVSSVNDDGTNVTGIVVGGTTYELDGATYRVGSDTAEKVLDKANFVTADGAVGKAVTLHLTAGGKVRFAVLSPETNVLVGIVTKSTNNKSFVSGSEIVSRDVFEVVTVDGASKTVMGKDDSLIGTDNQKKDRLVKFVLNSDGYATSVSDIITDTTGQAIADLDSGLKTITQGSSSYYVTADTKIMDYTGATPTVGSFASLAKTQLASVNADGLTAKYIVIRRSATKYGVGMSAWSETTADGTKNYVKLLTAGGPVTYTTASLLTVTKGTYASYTITAGNATVNFNPTGAKAGLTVTSVDSGTQTFVAGGTTYAVTPDTLIVKYTSGMTDPALASFSDLKANATVDLVEGSQVGSYTTVRVLIIKALP